MRPISTTGRSEARRSAAVTGLVCLGHFFSHFYYLTVLSSLPLLKASFGVSYTAMGVALAGYGLTATLLQVPLGYLIDRVGAPLILVAGLASSALALIGLGLASDFAIAAALLLLLGVGDAVFHPANYSILAHAIGEEHAAPAYSAHNFSGQLGFAAAPLLLGMAVAHVGWHAAVQLFGVAGLFAAAILLACRGRLAVRRAARPTATAAPAAVSWRLLFNRPILMCLLVFVGIGLTNAGMRDFGISALQLMYSASLSDVAFVVTTYLVVSLGALLFFGWVGARTRRYTLLATAGCVGISLVLSAVGSGRIPLAALAAPFAILGLCSGLILSSRDMIVRSQTAPEHAAKTFGFVSQGIGFATLAAPLLYTTLLDHAPPGLVFGAAATIALLTGLLVMAGRRQTARPRASGLAS